LRSRFTSCLLILAVLVTLAPGSPGAGRPAHDVSARARAIGTDKPQDEPARLIVTDPDRARLKFPAFVLGIEKARRETIGCPPDRGLDTSRAPEVVRDQIRRTFHETPFATDCLFVSHIAEFVSTSDPAVFKPVLRYNAYRKVDPPPPSEVFMSGRQATLALRGRLDEIAAERAARGRPISHVIVFATGWHTPQAKTLAEADELFASITAAAFGDDRFSPLFFGISWPSFSYEIAGNIRKGADLLVGLRSVRLDRSDPGDRRWNELEPREGIGKLRHLYNQKIVDSVGFVGYPAISKDADEVGMVPVSTLVNQVLIPFRETLPGRPPVVVIGHSFGARIASWTPFTAPLLPPVDGTAASSGPDLVIGLQGAFPAARFDTTVKHHRPYVEGASFADHGDFRTVFAYTCAPDEVLRSGRVFDVMIGDAKAFERARANDIPAFSTCMIIDGKLTGAELDPTSRKVLLIDATEITRRHSDVRNDKIGWLVWTLMRNLAPR
jgi:hypothetical protein